MDDFFALGYDGSEKKNRRSSWNAKPRGQLWAEPRDRMSKQCKQMAWTLKREMFPGKKKKKKSVLTPLVKKKW